MTNQSVVARLRRIACIAIFAANVLIGQQSSMAQTATNVPMPVLPERFNMAPGGVDMRTARYMYHATDLTIGDERHGGFSFVRTMPSFIPVHTTNPFGNFTNNWDVSFVMQNVDLKGQLLNGNLPPGNDLEVFVSYGGRTHALSSPYYSTGFGPLSGTDDAVYLSFTGTKGAPSSTYTFTNTDDTTVVFAPLGVINGLSIPGWYPVSVSKPDGTTYIYTYNSYSDGSGNHGRVQSITSSAGYALLMEGSGALVTKVCGLNLTIAPLPANNLCSASTQGTVLYGYSGSKLSSVTDAAGAVESFIYGTSGSGAATMAFVKPGQSTSWLTNTTSAAYDELDGLYDRIDSQSFADGQSYVYRYRHGPLMTGRVASLAGGNYADAQGQLTQVNYSFPPMPQPTCGTPPCPLPTKGSTVYQQTGGPTTVVDPLNRTITSDFCDPAFTTFCNVGYLQSFTNPEGVKTYLKFDSYNNIIQAQSYPKPGTSGSVITISKTFNCSQGFKNFCDLPISITNANGAVTSFTYDQNFGAMLTETDPQVVVNGAGAAIAPVKRYAYAQRYAWISNGSGGYLRGPAAMWLLSTQKTCRSSATNVSTDSCANGSADETVTSYDYGPDSGPNNLLVRGVAVTTGGVTRRTCYSYDASGHKISETLANAGLSSCP